MFNLQVCPLLSDETESFSTVRFVPLLLQGCLLRHHRLETNHSFGFTPTPSVDARPSSRHLYSAYYLGHFIQCLCLSLIIFSFVTQPILDEHTYFYVSKVICLHLFIYVNPFVFLFTVRFLNPSLSIQIYLFVYIVTRREIVQTLRHYEVVVTTMDRGVKSKFHGQR